MRITKNLLIVAFFALATLSASAYTDPTKTTTARQEIKEMITKSNVVKNLKEDLTLNVTFLVNAKNEIIIMSTDNEAYDAVIKSILNYKKLKSSDMKVNETYTLPIKMQKK